MRCHEFEQRLQDLLDQRESPEFDLDLTTHARQCEPCRRAMDAQRQLFVRLAQRHARSARPSGNAHRRRVRVGRDVGHWASRWVTALVAVMGFFAVGVLPWMHSARQVPSAVDVAAGTPAIRSSSNSVQALAASDPNLAVWHDLRRTLLSSSSTPDERSAEFPSGLRPLADSLQETFGGLRQLIPSPPSGSERPGMTVFRTLPTTA